MEFVEDLRYAPRLGLALGGGGALGAAHVGVLQVLRERALEPSIIVGTSAGAIAGGATALGIDPYDLERRIYKWGWTTFGTWTPKPGLGLLRADALHERVRNITGQDIMIEDLPTRFAAVATDIDTRLAHVVDHGSLAEGVAASIAVPGVFRPVTIEGHHLLDGGLVQNLPIEAALGLGATHVIAVRVAPEWELPGFESTFNVHEYEIRADVTVLTPNLAHRSQWQVRDLETMVALGREAAEREFADYPVVNERPVESLHAADETEESVMQPRLADAEMPPERHGFGALFHRR